MAAQPAASPHLLVSLAFFWLALGVFGLDGAFVGAAA